jgi:hypothetical protein
MEEKGKELATPRPDQEGKNKRGEAPDGISPACSLPR